MPKKRKQPDLFARVRRQAERALALLNTEIRRAEGELKRLLAQAELWRNAIVGAGSRAERLLGAQRSRNGRRRAARSPGGARRRGARVSWDEVLRSVPDRFGVEDVLKHPGARSKGRAQIYPALTRWQQAKKIKKVGPGRYQRT